MKISKSIQSHIKKAVSVKKNLASMFIQDRIEYVTDSFMAVAIPVPDTSPTVNIVHMFYGSPCNISEMPIMATMFADKKKMVENIPARHSLCSNYSTLSRY